MKKIHMIILLLLLPCCRLFADNLPAGQVIGWGLNISDEAIGVPTSGLFSTGIVKIAGQALTNTIAISAGMSHGLALKTDGTVVGWGNNMSGRAVGFETKTPYRTNRLVMINGRVLSNVTAIAAWQYSLALKRNGTVDVWGRDSSGKAIVVPKDLNNVVAIAAGFDQGLALKKDGTVISLSGVSVPVGLSNVVAIAASKEWFGKNLALKSDGTIVEWDNQSGRSDVVSGLSNAVAIATGKNHSLALKSDGTVFGWGGNGNGQATGIPTTTGSYASSGDVIIDGQILNNVIVIAAGDGYSLALKNNGTIVEWGHSIRHFTDIPAGLSDVVAIAAGGDFCLAITTNSAVADKFQH